MNNVPNWYTLLLLSLAAWRIYRLISADTILNQPRRYLLRLGDWQEDDDPVELPDAYRDKWAEFITCPYCLGAWSGLAWWTAWLIWPHATTLVAVPFAISALVVVISKLDTDE